MALQAPTFESKVNLVLVPVVVRDAHGRAVANLTKDDFQLFDKRKPQTIVSFSAIERASRPGRAITPAPGGPPIDSETTNRGKEEASSNRYLIYLFDDVDIRFPDMAHLRAAAVRYFQNSLVPGDRAAIYTVSGKPTLEFTGDREKLEGAVSELRWRANTKSSGMQCPDVSYYIADLVVEKSDSQALDALTNHTAECAHVPERVAVHLAIAAANREVIIGAQNTEDALRTLRRAIIRLSMMPGQRLVVLASPGFYAQTPQAIKATAEILNLAAKNNVVVSGLSARGVIVAEEEEDVTRKAASPRKVPPSATSPGQMWVRYRRESAREEGDVLKDLAEGTGGTFFHNNNDLNIGFERVASVPEFSYVLGFSPAEFKPDGSFHTLKVRLANKKALNVEARRGYYAIDGGAQEKSAPSSLSEAVFSHEERSDIPVVLQTGYSKPHTGDKAKILVVAKVDVSSFHQSVAEINRDPLSAIAALFDPEGNYLTGTADTVNLVDGDPAVTLRWEFDVKPGAYVLRLVIRGPEGNAISTMNRTVKIP